MNQPRILVPASAPVTLILPSLVGGGAERVATELANYWVADGRSVSLITIDAITSGNYPLDARVSLVGLGLMRVSRSMISALWNNTRRVRQLRQAIEASQPGHVVSFTDVTNVTTLLACRDSNVDTIVCERTEPRSHNIGRVWSRLRKRMYGRARAIVVQTQSVRMWAESQHWRIPVYTIPNAAPEIRPPVGDASGSERPAVVALGRLSREKGMDLLLEAFAQASRNHPDWWLRIYGEGSEQTELQSLAERCGIQQRVQFAGWTRDSQTALRDADIFVLPSRYEGFPNALLEAMALGVAAVSFDCDSGPREIIRPSIDGLLVPPGDIAGLAAALQQLMADAALRGRLGNQAREVTHRFSRAAFFQRWDAVLSGMPPEEFERLANRWDQ